MGNGLRKAISEERWDDVRGMLEDEDVQYRVRHKYYEIDNNGNSPLEGTSIYDDDDSEDDGDDDDRPWESVKALHLLLMKQHAPFDIIRKMLEIDGGQASRQITRRRHELPLHYALQYQNNRIDVIRLIVATNPEATRIPSAEGILPLHIACSNRLPISVIRILLDNDTAVDDNNNINPIENEINNEGGDISNEFDTRNVLDPNGDSPWDIIKKKSWFWEVKYRIKARKLLKVHPAAGTDHHGDVEEDRASLPSSDGESFHHSINGKTFHHIVKKKDIDTKDEDVKTIKQDYNRQQHDDNIDKIGAGLCVLCWDGVADHALVPCGHVCLCKKCCQQQSLGRLRRKCPVCSKTMERPMKIYYAGVVAQE